MTRAWKVAPITMVGKTSQSLPEAAVLIKTVQRLGTTAGNLVNIPIVSTTAATGKVVFGGKPSAATTKITFDAAQTSGHGLLVTYCPVGGAGAAA